jgi:heme/copper-type cytochrome/quinol oxidase subunit 4
MNEDLREIYKNLNTSQEKYIYFLLATTITAIGFAVTRTQNLKLSVTQTPLGIAVLLWGLSFLFGCLNRQYNNSILYANFELLKIQNGKHTEVGNIPWRIQSASEGIIEAITKNSDKCTRYNKLQTIFFILGVLSYIIWHVYQMYLNK